MFRAVIESVPRYIAPRLRFVPVLGEVKSVLHLPHSLTPAPASSAKESTEEAPDRWAGVRQDFAQRRPRVAEQQCNRHTEPIDRRHKVGRAAIHRKRRRRVHHLRVFWPAHLPKPTLTGSDRPMQLLRLVSVDVCVSSELRGFSDVWNYTARAKLFHPMTW